jgi:pyridoxamine 5'-phosphate oxidase
MDLKELAGIRKEYSREELSLSSVDPDPFVQFDRWMKEALAAELQEPTAMTLSTVSDKGRPSSRVVLLKGIDANGLVFFTNYESQKGRELTENPFAALSFFWPELERQIRIDGMASKIPADESDEYFASRPFTSRIGAWASDQSKPLTSKAKLITRAAALSAKYATGNVPRPPHWGGFRISPDRFEFWQGRPSRLHDRICYTRVDGDWQTTRLSP